MTEHAIHDPALLGTSAASAPFQNLETDYLHQVRMTEFRRGIKSSSSFSRYTKPEWLKPMDDGFWARFGLPEGP